MRRQTRVTTDVQRGSTRLVLAAVALAYVLLALAWWWPLPTRLADVTLAQPFGDPLLNTWTLAWGADRLPHGLSGFWTGLFFHPYPDTVAYSEHLLGISVFTAPLQWWSGNPVVAFNAAMIASTALAGIGMFLLAREVTGQTAAAVVAGVVFAWAPYRVAQIYHLQVLMSGWMPLALFGLHRYFRTGRPAALVLLVVAFVLQAFSNGYFLYFTALPVAIVGASELVHRRAAATRHLRDLALAASVILLALTPVALAYVRARREQGLVRSAGDLALYSPPLEAYAHVVERLWLWGGVLPVGRQEFELFPGLAVLVLACLAVARAVRSVGEVHPNAAHEGSDLTPRQATWIYLVVTLAALVLSLGPYPVAFGWQSPVAGPYAWLLAVVPGLDGLRVPARLATVVYLGLAVLGALGFAAVTRRLNAVRQFAAAGALTLVVMAEGYAGPPPLAPFPTPDMHAEADAYAWLRAQPPGPMLELPVGDALLATRHLYRTLEHRHPVVNGYSGYGSALQTFLGGPPFTELAHIDESLHMARTLGLRWIVLHPHLYDHPAAAQALGQAMASARHHVRRMESRAGALLFELRPLPPYEPTTPDPTWAELSSDTWQADASHRADTLAYAFDRNRQTRWATAERQQAAEWVTLRFDTARDVARVRLEIEGRSFGDYPRGLVVESSVDGTAWQPLFTGGALVPLASSLVREPLTPAIDIVLPENRTRILRLRTTGETRVWFWSIHELRLWERTGS